MKKITLLLVLIVPFFAFSQFNVTFQVDMNQYSGTFTTPEVNGTFNAWCGNCAPMADANSDGIWDITISLAADTFEFKFSHDNWGGQENLTPGMPCTVTNGGFTNRSLVITKDTTLPAFCWEACSNCAGAPMNADITFQVDMSEYTANTYTDVNLNGTFNSWCGGCAIMQDPDNDSIYELTVGVNVGDTIEFKYTLDGWTHDESLNPMPCTMTDGTGQFTNRFLVVTGDTTMPPVCWESCGPCGSTAPIGIEENWIEGLTISPNPSKGVIYLEGFLQNEQTLQLSVIDLQGKMITEKVVISGASLNETLDLSTLNQGIYMLNINNGSEYIQEKIVINR